MIRPRLARPWAALAAAYAALAAPALGPRPCGPFAGTALAADGSTRLPSGVTPLFQSIRLVLDARTPGYSGSTRIEIRVEEPTDAVHFHAEAMDLKRVSLEGPNGTVPLAPRHQGGNIVAARAPGPIAPGAYTLSIEFANEFDTRASGLYRLESGGEAYAFTQFQAIDARKAFPCWDEPAFKFPYQLTVSVPEAHQAVSNTPPARETVEQGVRTIEFARTKPLPSYLLAIAAGPLEFVPIPGLRVPGRVVTPKGSSHLAKVATAMTPPIFDAVEAYFGTPYPFEKLDLIAVPEYSPGAMENPGAITYADRFLLFDEATMSASQRRTFAKFTAHEIAHMWFGDLVTMRWWDDLWLNEAFAGWLGNKISDRVYPQYLVRLQALTEVERAFELDAQQAARAVRQPVTTMENLLQAADALAYDKGQAVLGMTERWLGPEVFRAGVLDYLERHAWGNAEGKDLFDALARASGKDVGGVLASFLDQPGVPIVHVEVAGRAVTLSQKRFASYGKSGPAQVWKIPVTLMWESAGVRRTESVLLDRERMAVTLGGGAAPAWVHPNADEEGYYLWSADAKSLERLVASAPSALNPRERIGIIQNATALLRAGGTRGDQFLGVLSGFPREENPLVVSALANAVDVVRESFVTEPLEEAFAAFVRRVLGPPLRRFGLDRAPGEAEAVSLARPKLIRLLADEGRDEAALAHAEALARSFLKDRASIDPSMVSPALSLSAVRGDEALFEEYRRRFEAATVPTDRQPLLIALGSFRDPALREKALAYAASGPIRPQELFWIPNAMAATPAFRDQVWRWWRDHYDRIASRMPPEYVIFIPYAAGGCSEERLADAEAFFALPEHSPAGMKTELAKMAEGVRDCAGLRAREGASVARALAEAARAK